MFLKKILLQNFKCLANVTLSFEQASKTNRTWTLLLGENGTGKSNLLKAIALVTAGSNALGELIGNVDNWIRYNEASCTITAELQTKKGEERTISLTLNRGDNLSKIVSNNQQALQQIDDAIEHAARNYFVVGYGSSRRLNADSFSGFEKSRFGPRSVNVISLFDNSFSLNPLSSWIIELDYRSGQEGINIVKDALSDFLPGITYHSIDKSKKQVLFQTPDGIIPLEQLSDGYQNMAAWIGDLLFRITDTFTDYRKPLEARGLLLMDELDLHLHPKWQRQLITFMSERLPNFQIIATTHSPLTAQQVSEGELYALKREKDNHIVLIPFIGSPKTLLVNQLLMTPVFGLETDESYVVEETKEEYAKLAAKEDSLDAAGKEKLRTVTKELKDILPQRKNLVVSEKENELLARIETSLQQIEKRKP